MTREIQVELNKKERGANAAWSQYLRKGRENLTRAASLPVSRNTHKHRAKIDRTCVNSEYLALSCLLSAFYHGCLNLLKLVKTSKSTPGASRVTHQTRRFGPRARTGLDCRDSSPTTASLGLRLLRRLRHGTTTSG